MNRKRTIRKGELRNVEVELVSLLFDEMTPANQKGFVVKNASGKSFEHKINSAKFKSETQGTQGRLYVTLMEPNIHDSQGDFYSREEIQKACDHFAKHGLVGKCDVNHNMQPVPEFTVVENYILKTMDHEHFPNTKVGAWVQVLKCEDLNSELWQKVEKGEFNGVSIYGRADDYLSAEASLAEIKNELNSLRKVAEQNNNSELQKGIDNITDRISELEKNSGPVLVSDAVKSIEKSLKDLSVTMSRAISKSIPGEPDVNQSTVDKEVSIDGNKIMVKASHREIYKGISDVDSGKAMNILTANTTSLFIDEVIASQPGDTLSDISVLPLLKDEKIDVGLIDDLVFKNSLDGALTAQNVSTADLSVPTGILNAEFTLGRDVVEFYKDKYGEDAFGAYVENHIAKKTEKAIRLLLFKGDRASATAKIKALDGIVKLATTKDELTQNFNLLGELAEKPGKTESKLSKLKTRNYSIPGKRTNTVELNIAGLSSVQKNYLESNSFMGKTITIVVASKELDRVVVFNGLRWTVDWSGEADGLFNVIISTEFSGVTSQSIFLFKDISEGI